MHHRLVFASLLLAACSTSGSSDFATLTATWSVRHADGAPSMCSGAYTTIKVSATPWNNEHEGVDPGSGSATALFDCAAGSGTMMLQTSGESDLVEFYTLSGKYDVAWTQTDASGETAILEDVQTQLGVSSVVDLSHGDQTAAMTLYPEDGYMWLEWGLFGVTANQDLASCATAGVDRIELALTQTTTMAQSTLSFPCETADVTLSGVTGVAVDALGMLGGGVAPLAPGEYSYIATAYAGTTAVGTSDMSTFNVYDKNHVAIVPDETSISITTR